MPESDLDAFIMSIAKMFEEAEYGLPDVHGSNVFMSDGKLKLIDNYMIAEKSLREVEGYKDDNQKIAWEPGEPSQEELEAVKQQIIG